MRETKTTKTETARAQKFGVGARVRVRRLLEDKDWIEAETGVKDVCVGLIGRVTNARLSESPGYVEIKLEREGEELAFHVSELEVIG